MDLVELQRKMIAVARKIPANDHVPYAFEQRIIAQLTGRKVLDVWGWWGRALSRAAVCCVILVLFLSAGSFLLPSANSDTLSQDVDQTLFASAENSADQEAW